MQHEQPSLPLLSTIDQYKPLFTNCASLLMTIHLDLLSFTFTMPYYPLWLWIIINHYSPLSLTSGSMINHLFIYHYPSVLHLFIYDSGSWFTMVNHSRSAVRWDPNSISCDGGDGCPQLQGHYAANMGCLTEIVHWFMFWSWFEIALKDDDW